MSAYIKNNFGVKVSKQSLHDKFTQSSVEMLKMILKEVLEKSLPEISYPYRENAFKDIRIKDSTCFQIPEELQEYYSGSGGSGSKAAVRIQYEFGILSGKIYDLSLHAFNEQDQSDSKSTLDDILHGDFLIRDLGYVNLDYLSRCNEVGAFYLNRFPSNTKAYLLQEDKYTELNFRKLHKQMQDTGISQCEKEVFMGKQKLKTRMILTVLPQDIVAERLRKTQQSKKKGEKLSAEYKARAHFNLFITNLDENVLSASKACDLYKIRWQIELVFKTWKSFCHIDKCKKVKKERFETCLYARLVRSVLHWKLFKCVGGKHWKEKKELLSVHKFYKIAEASISKIRDSILKSWSAFHRQINTIFDCSENLLLEKKKKKVSLEHLYNILLE